MQDDKAPLEGSDYEYEGYGSADHEHPDWLALARSAYESSTDYLDKTYRKQFEKNLSNFQSRHPAGSKYYSDAYKTRSRLFRPKTRTAVRKNEAALAAALFASVDVVVLEAEDMDDAQKRQDAAYWHEILNYRLDKSIPWYQLVIGAFQEAQVYGCVCSKQYWEYEEAEGGKELVPDLADPSRPAMDNDGNPIYRPEMEVIKDRPKVRLVEIENIRFDPACDWTDPVNSSPYIIECLPMYVGDVLDRMERVDEKTGQPEWKPLEKAKIIAAGANSQQSDDTTRQQRQNQSNSPEAEHHVSEFETVWVHENIIRWKGIDYVYYTLSTQELLSEPQPLDEVYEHGIRPYVVGKAVIEAHKPIPSGTVELSENLQAEANDVVNQRLDNVKQVLNKRKYVERDSDWDLNAMLKSVPGGIVLGRDIANTVKEEDVRDVTSSSYNEQTRLDTDFDDIAGVFSTASVQNNRQLNETVGGMELMSQSANQDSEYLIRTFVETWVEPVLRQLVLLEQYYEDDEHIRDIALKNVEKEEQKIALKSNGQQQQPAQEGQVADVPIEEPQNVDVRVNVGFGAASPDQRVKKVMSGLNIMGQVAPWTLQKLDAEEVAKEIFGALGHKNGHKFFTDLNMPEQQIPPEVQVQMEELKVKQQELEIKEAELTQKAQYDQAKLNQEYELKLAEIASREKITLEQLYSKLGIDKEKMQQEREIAGAKNLATLAGVEQKENELQFKSQTGRQGI